MRFLTPFPSPASAIEKEREAFMAGEGVRGIVKTNNQNRIEPLLV
jgi:hypothetical protein